MTTNPIPGAQSASTDALAATIRDSVTATGRIVKQLGIQPQ